MGGLEVVDGETVQVHMTHITNTMKLYLASTSPRRKELLSTLNIPFEVISPLFEEKTTSLSALEESLYFAEGKARSVSSLCPQSLIIGSDTLIECEGEKIGKPHDEKSARMILQTLSGKKHFVFTSVVLLDTRNDSLKKHTEEVSVFFRLLSTAEIEDYMVTGEPLGKAGAYALQGEGKNLIQKIKGNPSAVIGLPLEPLREWFEILSLY